MDIFWNVFRGFPGNCRFGLSNGQGREFTFSPCRGFDSTRRID